MIGFIGTPIKLLLITVSYNSSQSVTA
jgi:hypothetical protein